MSKESMSGVDAAWLHMDHPTNLMMINGFFQTAGQLDFDRVRLTLERRLLQFERFRQRIVEPRFPWKSVSWEIDPHFNLDSHLHRIALPAPGTETELRALLDDLSSTPLDLRRPLWQIHVIENVDGGSVLFVRLHHCIADGMALMHVMLSTCDENAEADIPEELPEPKRNKNSLAQLLKPARNAISSAKKITGTLINSGMEIAKNPDKAIEHSRTAADIARTLGKLALMPTDKKTSLQGDLGVLKCTSWSKPLPLDEIKMLGRQLGGTVNDVLVALATGAIRRYLEERGDEVDEAEIRAMVPVNLRPLDEAWKLGNQFGLVLLPLPVDVSDPLERLQDVKASMDELKQSPQAMVAYALLQALGLAPAEIEARMVDFFASKASAVMTNVPGPREKLYFAGQRIDRVMFWVPQSGKISLGVSILSYAGEVTLGVISDQQRIPDPDRIINGFMAEFEALKLTLKRRRLRLVGKAQSEQAPATPTQEPAAKRQKSKAASAEQALCAGTTKAGKPCKNKAQPGSSYCRIHSKLAAKEEQPETDKNEALALQEPVSKPEPAAMPEPGSKPETQEAEIKIDTSKPESIVVNEEANAS